MNKRLNPAEVSALDKITATQGKEIEVRNTAEKVADLKLKLNEIKDKESLSDEDKLIFDKMVIDNLDDYVESNK